MEVRGGAQALPNTLNIEVLTKKYRKVRKNIPVSILSERRFARTCRTGFDLIDAPEAACRGRFVGLVNPRTKT
jgi:hypothetical protein